MKKKLWIQSLAITVFVFFMLWVANKVTDLKLFTAFDTIGQAMRDFELTDYAFSKLRETPNVDEKIVLVNFGSIDRRTLAQVIQKINTYKPRVIGIDGFYNCEGGLRDSINCPQLLDTLGNLMLGMSMAEADRVVLATKLMQTKRTGKIDTDVYDSLEVSDPLFMEHAFPGFVSLPTNATYQEDVKLCRSVFPKITVNGKDQLAFSVQIAMQYDSVKTKKFLARNKPEELINFRGNVEVKQLRVHSGKDTLTNSSNYPTYFYAVEYDQVLRDEVLPTLFEDNIIILGYMGDYMGDPSWEDKFFTPLNSKVAGRANPDMFGLVLHANVVAMILNEDYINEIPTWLQYAIAFAVCLMTVSLFIFIDKKLPTWFDALSFVIQVTELLLISALIVFAFYWWSLKLELAVALGVSALVGPSYDIFKSFQNEYNKRFTKAREPV
ncbi:MAG TPA: CHASE2 domain-containing protein [Cyclobacteriaceae bacterium]|nr:CHASE2 domain-containing protein [Cyclobacteriaceae bacterium]